MDKAKIRALLARFQKISYLNADGIFCEETIQLAKYLKHISDKELFLSEVGKKLGLLDIDEELGALEMNIALAPESSKIILEAGGVFERLRQNLAEAEAAIDKFADEQLVDKLEEICSFADDLRLALKTGNLPEFDQDLKDALDEVICKLEEAGKKAMASYSLNSKLTEVAKAMNMQIPPAQYSAQNNEFAYHLGGLKMLREACVEMYLGDDGPGEFFSR